jgi:hypothetical protein
MCNFVIVQPQAGKILFGQPLDAFLPPFFGALIGVVLGFVASLFLNRYINHQTKLKFIDMFYKELTQAGEVIKDIDEKFYEKELNGNLILTISINVWISSLNSGVLKFFSSNQSEELSKIYADIMKYNGYIKNYLDLLIQFPDALGRDSGSLTRKEGGGFIVTVHRREISSCSKKLRDEIENIMRKEGTLEKAKTWSWWKLWEV